MKKAVLVLFTLACVSGAWAQQLKFMLGPDFSSYTGRWPSSIYPGSLGQPSGLNPFKNQKTASVEGFGLEVKIHGMLRVEVDALYSYFGSSFVQPTALFTVQKEVYDMSALSFPVLVKLRPQLKHVAPYVLAGMELVAVLSHDRISLVLPEASLIYEEIAREDLSKATRKFDVGPLVGIGIEVRLLNQAFFLEMRYHAGLGNLVDGYPSPYSARLRSFAALIGYQMK